MNRLLTALFLLILPCAQAQVTGVAIETVAEHTSGDLNGFTTYRLYAETTDSLDYVLSLWGNATHPLVIESSGTIYQSGIGSAFGWNINPIFFDAWDSWLTLGYSSYPTLANDNYSVDPFSLGPWVPEFESGQNLHIDSQSGGGLFAFLPDPCLPMAEVNLDCLSLALNENDILFGGDELRVLVAQITTNGSLSGRLNIQYLSAGDNASSLATGLYFSTEPDAVPGCTDATALNYDLAANSDDGTCVFPCDHPTLQLAISPSSTGVCGDEFGTITLDISGGQGYRTVTSNTLLGESCLYGPGVCNGSLDITGDWVVTVDDIMAFIDQFSSTCDSGPTCADHNGDGYVTTSDLLMTMGGFSDIPDVWVFEGLPVGVYDYEVTDAQGCSVAGTVTVELANPTSGYDCDGNCVNDADGDGTCDEYEIFGCTDPTGCNFDPNATEENGSCDFSCYGCVDPQACNFSPSATIPTSCLYLDAIGECGGDCASDSNVNGVCDSLEACSTLGEEFWLDVPLGAYSGTDVFTLTIGLDTGLQVVLNAPLAYVDPVTGGTFQVLNWSNLVIDNLPNGLSASNLPPDMSGATQHCLALEGTPTEFGSWDVTVSGLVVLDFFGSPFSVGDGQGIFSIEVEPNPAGSPGCMYPTADNYLHYATIDDGSCAFEGCTDPFALNFSSAHSVEDGSCVYGDCDGEGPSLHCPDLDANGLVGAADLLMLLGSYGSLCE